MLTSKQRAEFRSQANSLETTLIVGKGGVTEQVIEQAEILLDAKELVKGKVLETAMVTPREACDAICEATGAEGVQIVGTKFVFYRHSEKLERQRAAAKAKKKVNPVRAGVQARRKRAKAEKEKIRQRYHDEAVQSAIRRRMQQENET